MGLFTRLIFEVTLIFLSINRGDGFMFSAWLRGTTEKNLSTLGQYKYQNYATNEALSSVAGAYRYASKKDVGKANVVATAAAVTSQSDKDVVAAAPAYHNQRRGISSPPKYDKAWNVFDAVVVHSIPSASVAAPPPLPLPSISYVAIPAHNYPYLYYRDEAKAPPAQNIATFTTSPAPLQKSVNVELNYKDGAVVEKIGENVVLNRKIPSVVLDPVQPTVESLLSPATSTAIAAADSSSTPFMSDSSFKVNVPNRPIKLLGTNAIYTPPAPANLTFTPPQFYYAPAVADIQYVPYPLFRSPPVASFLSKNTPRAVFERSEIAPQPSASRITIPKPEKSVCENCVLSSAFANYSHALKIFDSNENVLHKPCEQESAATARAATTALQPNTAISANFKSSDMAYVLVPSQIIRNRTS